jgi:hypothetical protein
MFLKSTLTVPKIKDLVNSPNQKYKNIYDTISHNPNYSEISEMNHNPNSYTRVDLLPSDEQLETTDQTSMKNELKSFLKKQLNNDSNSGDLF